MAETPRRHKLAKDIAWSQCYIQIAQFGFSKKQIIYLQGVNRFLYKRVTQWLRTVSTFPNIRLSEMSCPNPDSTKVLVFPTEAMIKEWDGVLHTLVGVENIW